MCKQVLGAQVAPAVQTPKPADQPSMPAAQPQAAPQQNQAGPQSMGEAAMPPATQPSQGPAVPGRAEQPHTTPITWALPEKVQQSENPAVPGQAERPSRSPIVLATPQKSTAQPVASDAPAPSQQLPPAESAMPPGFDNPSRGLPATVAVAHDAVFNTSGPPALEKLPLSALLSMAPTPAHSMSRYGNLPRATSPLLAVSSPMSLQQDARRDRPIQASEAETPVSPALPGLGPSLIPDARQHTPSTARRRRASPSRHDSRASSSRHDSRNVKEPGTERPSSRTGTRDAARSAERLKPLTTPAKQLPLKRASADTVMHPCLWLHIRQACSEVRVNTLDDMRPFCPNSCMLLLSRPIMDAARVRITCNAHGPQPEQITASLFTCFWMPRSCTNQHVA